MRDPKRIKEILNFLEKIWTKYPDMRLMQLLLAAIGSNTMINTDEEFSFHAIDHFNTEDNYVLEKLREKYSDLLTK